MHATELRVFGKQTANMYYSIEGWNHAALVVRLFAGKQTIVKICNFPIPIPSLFILLLPTYYGQAGGEIEEDKSDQDERAKEEEEDSQCGPPHLLRSTLEPFPGFQLT
jgi:hypothetical protein